MNKPLLLLLVFFLSQFSFGEEIVRFDWDRSFHGKIGISIKHESSGYYLSILNSKGVVQSQFAIEAPEVNRILSSAESCDFYSQQSYDPSLKIDGSMWTIFIKTDAQPYQVKHYSPEDGCIREIGEILISISKLNVERSEIY